MDEQEFLPLTEVALEVLLSLSDGAKHGYAIMTEVADRTEGRLKLHPGTLYRALSRMLDGELIEEVDSPRDRRRRRYEITKLGRKVARLEILRLSRQLQVARRSDLIDEEELA